MRVKQLFAGGAVLAGFIGYAYFDEANRYEAAAKAYGLSPAQAEVMRACRGSLSRHNRDFEEDIDPFRGCACVAKRLTDHVPAAQYPAASRMLDIIVQRSQSGTKTGLSQQIRADQMVGGLAPIDKHRLVMNTTSAVGFCGRAKNHARQAAANIKAPKID